MANRETKWRMLEKMDEIPPRWYHKNMEHNTTKIDGFRRQRMIVLPTEALDAYRSHPLVRRLYLTDVGFFPQARHHTRTRREGIEEYILLYCVAGSGDIWVEDRHYRIGPNEAFCIPRRCPHCYAASEENPWSLLWVHFKGEDADYYPLEDCRIIHPASAEEHRMLSLFELLFGALEDDYSLGNFIYLSQVLALILAELYQRQGGDAAPGQNRHLTRAIRYMYRHLGENLTLEDLCRETGLSKSYLNAIFQSDAHRAPLQFFLHLKMIEACKLLQSTDLPIYQVAQRLGYGDPYYFSRQFRKAVGVSPRTYRKGGYFYGEE